MALWNNPNVTPPPTCRIPYSPEEIDDFGVMEKLTNLFNNALSQFTQQSQVMKTEMVLMKKIVYKMNNQFRHEKSLGGMKLIVKCLEAFFRSKFSDVIEKFKDHLTDTSDSSCDVVYLPSRQLLQFVLVKVMGMTQLLNQTITYAETAYNYVMQHLRIGHFIANNMVFLSLISRTWVLCRSLLLYFMTWYNDVKTWEDRLKAAQAQWLPEGEPLPVNLANWLGIQETNQETSTLSRVFDTGADTSLQSCKKLPSDSDSQEIEPSSHLPSSTPVKTTEVWGVEEDLGEKVSIAHPPPHPKSLHGSGDDQKKMLQKGYTEKGQRMEKFLKQNSKEDGLIMLLSELDTCLNYSEIFLVQQKLFKWYHVKKSHALQKVFKKAELSSEWGSGLDTTSKPSSKGMFVNKDLTKGKQIVKKLITAKLDSIKKVDVQNNDSGGNEIDKNEFVIDRKGKRNVTAIPQGSGSPDKKVEFVKKLPNAENETESLNILISEIDKSENYQGLFSIEEKYKQICSVKDNSKQLKDMFTKAVKLQHKIEGKMFRKEKVSKISNELITCKLDNGKKILRKMIKSKLSRSAKVKENVLDSGDIIKEENLNNFSVSEEEQASDIQGKRGKKKKQSKSDKGNKEAHPLYNSAKPLHDSAKPLQDSAKPLHDAAIPLFDSSMIGNIKQENIDFVKPANNEIPRKKGKKRKLSKEKSKTGIVTSLIDYVPLPKKSKITNEKDIKVKKKKINKGDKVTFPALPEFISLGKKSDVRGDSISPNKGKKKKKKNRKNPNSGSGSGQNKKNSSHPVKKNLSENGNGDNPGSKKGKKKKKQALKKIKKMFSKNTG